MTYVALSTKPNRVQDGCIRGVLAAIPSKTGAAPYFIPSWCSWITENPMVGSSRARLPSARIDGSSGAGASSSGKAAG